MAASTFYYNFDYKRSKNISSLGQQIVYERVRATVHRRDDLALNFSQGEHSFGSIFIFSFIFKILNL